MATWPAGLQQLLNVDSFQYNFGNTALRSENDVGPAKVRRRATKAVDNLTCSIICSYEDFQDIYDFWDVDLNGGVEQFEFAHPFTGDTENFRMVTAPSMVPLGGTQFLVSMNWEKMP